MSGVEHRGMPELGETARDRIAALAKGGIGTVPVVGSILAEIVGQFIPNQRLDRIEDYLRRLDDRLRAAEGAPRAPLTEPEAIDLIEEGGWQSARATSGERRDYIARLVADGLSGDERKRIESKRLLRLLGELDDDQIIILTSYLRRYIDDHEYRHRHKHLIGPRNVSSAEPKPVRDAATAREIAHHGLERLGLIRQMLPNRKPEDPLRYDLYGKVMGGHLLPSLAGLELLRSIGLASENDY